MTYSDHTQDFLLEMSWTTLLYRKSNSTAIFNDEAWLFAINFLQIKLAI